MTFWLANRGKEGKRSTKDWTNTSDQIDQEIEDRKMEAEKSARSKEEIL
jgi:hypothetical protein